MCPMLEHAAPQCAQRLTLSRIVRTFTHCVACYEQCPVYQAYAHSTAQPARAENAARAAS
jgi:hypothetical protein